MSGRARICMSRASRSIAALVFCRAPRPTPRLIASLLQPCATSWAISPARKPPPAHAPKQLVRAGCSGTLLRAATATSLDTYMVGCKLRCLSPQLPATGNAARLDARDDALDVVRLLLAQSSTRRCREPAAPSAQPAPTNLRRPKPPGKNVSVGDRPPSNATTSNERIISVGKA